MAARDDKSPQALGFLTVVEHAQHGLFGGYLLLNSLARPLEFHCTTPVRPSAAQRILFGPTLDAYLFGEQIAATLIAASSVRPLAVFTDCRPVLAVKDHADVTILFVDSAADSLRAGDRHLGGEEPLETIRIAGHEFCTSGDDSHAGGLGESLASVIEGWDMLEPFERIRAAIDQAQRSAA